MLLLVMTGCWTVSVQAHSNHPDPAGISWSLWGRLIIACQSACPLIQLGPDMLCKVQPVCGVNSVADTVSVTETGGSVLSVTLCLCSPGCGTVRSKKNTFDGLLLFAHP